MKIVSDTSNEVITVNDTNLPDFVGKPKVWFYFMTSVDT